MHHRGSKESGKLKLRVRKVHNRKCRKWDVCTYEFTLEPKEHTQVEDATEAEETPREGVV